MTIKIHLWLSALPLSLCVVSTAIANEPKLNEHKNYRTGDFISDVDYVGHADRHASDDVDTAADLDDQQAEGSTSDTDFYMQMEQRRRETERAQKDAYQRYLDQMERRMQQAPNGYALPADMQQRRNLFLKHMDERKQMIDRMRDEKRKAVEIRRNEKRLQMNQTCTETATAEQT